MIDVNAVSEVISTYRRYGWVLRRILLKRIEDGSSLAASIDLGDAKIATSAINAAWFSRPPKAGPVAWEIRYLGNIPFALLETLEENGSDFEYLLSKTEARLLEAISAKEAS